MFAVGGKSDILTSPIGEPYSFLYTKQKSQQWKEAIDFLSMLALTYDILFRV